MKTIETEVLVEAPVELLWKVFINFSEYKNWNALMTISGKPIIGNKIKLSVHLEDKISVFNPRITLIEPERKFEWLVSTGHRRIFSGNHYFHFHPEGEGQTRFVHGEHYSGVFSRSVLKRIEKSTMTYFEMYNQAIRVQAEDLVI